MGAVAATLSECLAAELQERRGFLWLAACFGIGPIVYFALPREPEPLAIAIVLVGLILLSIAGRERAGIRRSALCALAVAAGLGTAQFRVASLSGPQIESPFAAEIEGRVIRREDRVERRPRIVLDKVRIGVGDREEPRRIRLSLTEGAELPPVGVRIGLKARLMPVPGPSVPGGYDPRRAAFFDGIGGGGSRSAAGTSSSRHRSERLPFLPNGSARPPWRASARWSRARQARSRQRSWWASGAGCRRP